MLSEDDEATLKQKIVEFSEGKSVTDEELYEQWRKLVVEYSELFPTEGKVKSLEFIVDFIFLFIGDMHKDRHYHNWMLVDFCRETIQEQLLTERWQNSEDVAFQLLTHLALTTTYSDGSSEVISAFEQWVYVSHIVIENEQNNGVEWDDLGRHYFIRLTNMYNHDVLFTPSLQFWNSLIDQYGTFEVTEGVKNRMSDYLTFVEEQNAEKPPVIAHCFQRLQHYSHRLDWEELNDRLAEGIFRHNNV